MVIRMLSRFVYEPEAGHDFHSPNGVTLGELIEGGFVDWTAPGWQFDAYDEEQRARFTKKFNAHYFNRTIGMEPPVLWRNYLINRLNEIMPKYDILYAKIDKDFDPFAASYTVTSQTTSGHSSNTSEMSGVNGSTTDSMGYGKGRQVGSDFPASQLGDTSTMDYASGSQDQENESHDTTSNGGSDRSLGKGDSVSGGTTDTSTTQDSDVLEKFLRITAEYNDVDLIIINELEDMFSSLISINLNAL